jgi:hypothetical protein
MLIETTMHVHKSILEMLEKSSETTGRARTYMIKLLMQRVMRDNQKLLKSYSIIKYQERDLKENWHRIHIILNEYEYEYFLDMRKFFKMSVSFILAYAVMRYLDEVMNELLKKNINADNYHYINYVFIKETVYGIVCWKIYWGIPTHLTAL